MILLLATLCSLTATPLTNAVEAAAMTDAGFAAARPFALEGTVVAPMRFHDFVLADATGRAYLRDDAHETPPAAGTQVRVAGYSRLDDDRNRLLVVTNLQSIGTANVPSPRPLSSRELLTTDCDLESVTLTGTIVEAAHDDIDYRWDMFVLKEGPHLFHVAVPRDPALADFDRLLGAEARVTGTVVSNIGGRRIFRSPLVTLHDYTDLNITRPVPADPFDCPELEELHHISPERIAAFGRRCISGTVLAAWNGNRFFLTTTQGRILIVTLAPHQALPAVGSSLDVVGFPETDLFRINLSRAHIRPADAPALSPPTMRDIRPEDVLLLSGRQRINAEFQGQAVRLTGIVRDLAQKPDGAIRLSLACGDYLIPIDATASRSATELELGSRIAVRGICLLTTEGDSSSSVLPRITGFTVITRADGDIKVLATPSWWTPVRLVYVIGALFALLCVILYWNRLLKRLVDRRGRALYREQIARADADLKVDERTRLAVELHDALSQTLTGVAFQIDAAEAARTRRPEQVGHYLDVARRTLVSCREELRNCLWDLRNHALEERTLDESIRKTLAPHTTAAKVTVNCPIPRKRLTDNTTHDILCIIRELVVNAIRHGKATEVRIEGSIGGDEIRLSVTDDGCGFDPKTCPGIAQGHYGLQGISERIKRLGGTLVLDCAPGQGSHVTFTIETQP